MRRTPLVLAACCALLAPMGACSDDDQAGGDPSSTAATVTTEGTCGVLDVAHASEVMGVGLDEAVPGDSSCTYTSSESATAFTIQVSEQGADDPALVIETLGATCDPGTRAPRPFADAEGGFTCLAGGVPTVVAAGQGLVMVMTGNSREEGVTTEMVADDLVAILEDALRSFAES